jgi:hypothetical protein
MVAVKAERYGDFGRVMERIGNHYIEWQKTQPVNYAKCYNHRFRRLDHTLGVRVLIPFADLTLPFHYLLLLHDLSIFADDLWTADSFFKQTVFFLCRYRKCIGCGIGILAAELLLSCRNCRNTLLTAQNNFSCVKINLTMTLLMEWNVMDG